MKVLVAFVIWALAIAAERVVAAAAPPPKLQAQPEQCVRIILAPPGAAWFVRNDTLILAIRPPLKVAWFCPKGMTPPSDSGALPPAPVTPSVRAL